MMDHRKAAAVTLRPFCIAVMAAGRCLFLSQLIRSTRATVLLAVRSIPDRLCTLA
jgi:hypothetical protein